MTHASNAIRFVLAVSVILASCSCEGTGTEGESASEGEGEGEGEITSEGEGDQEGDGEGEQAPILSSQEAIEAFASAEHSFRYADVYFGSGARDLTPLRDVSFQTEILTIIDSSFITTTDGLNAVEAEDIYLGRLSQLREIVGFDLSPDAEMFLSPQDFSALERIDLPFARVSGGWWPGGNLCTILTPSYVGDEEYCERVRTEVPMCGTPENPQPAVLVTGCPP